MLGACFCTYSMSNEIDRGQSVNTLPNTFLTDNAIMFVGGTLMCHSLLNLERFVSVQGL